MKSKPKTQNQVFVRTPKNKCVYIDESRAFVA